jgi:hypothetical protein
LTSAPEGFPPGLTIEHIETDGAFTEWIGVSNQMNCDRFVDYELMSKNHHAIVYVRRATNVPSALDIQRELSLVLIRNPGSWVVDAPLDRICLSDRR